MISNEHNCNMAKLCNIIADSLSKYGYYVITFDLLDPHPEILNIRKVFKHHKIIPYSTTDGDKRVPTYKLIIYEDAKRQY